jgi:hypothetical protein
MLHLFNSCYVYPDVLFSPTTDYVVVGEGYLGLGSSVESSFFYKNVNVKQCLGRFETYEEFVSSLLFKEVIANTTKIIIYADTISIIKFHAGLLKTHIRNLSEDLYLDLTKLFAARMGVRSKLVTSGLKNVADAFSDITSSSSVGAFPLTQSWVSTNAGIEWKIINNKLSGVSDLINRHVYSYFEEARCNYLSRNFSAASWATDPNNQRYETVISMKDLYLEMRKEVCIFLDSLILNFYDTGSHNILDNPKQLLLLVGNGDMADKIDIWLLRWFMKMDNEQIQALDIV